MSNSPEYRTLCRSYGIVAGKYLSDDVIDLNNEYRTYVMRLYKILLDRRGDEQGLRAWVRHLTDGVTYQRVLFSFVSSSEFKNKGLSESDIVRTLFMAWLLREPTDDELSKYIQNMRMTNVEMTVFLLSKEYDIVF